MSEMVIGKRSGLVSDWLSNRLRAEVRSLRTHFIGPTATKSTELPEKSGGKFPR
jgi:hypothetical protein